MTSRIPPFNNSDSPSATAHRRPSPRRPDVAAIVIPNAENLVGNHFGSNPGNFASLGRGVFQIDPAELSDLVENRQTLRHIAGDFRKLVDILPILD
jgi:hypothetical protein